jgi:hypothetical protein
VRDVEDGFVRRVSEELREPVRVSEGFDARVMAEVRAGGTGRPPEAALAWRWLLRPRTVRVSPLVGLALAAGLAGVAVLAGNQRGAERVIAATATGPRGDSAPSATPVVPVAARPALVATRFVLPARAAASVAVIGQFNDWDAAATPLERRADGTWEALVPLAPGRYEYAFVVDGVRVIADPSAPLAEASDFEVPNSVVFVGGDVP